MDRGPPTLRKRKAGHPAPHPTRPGPISRGRAWARYERRNAAWDLWQGARGLLVFLALLAWGLVRTARGQTYGPEIASAGLFGVLWLGWVLVGDLRTGRRVRRLEQARRRRGRQRGSDRGDADTRR